MVLFSGGIIDTLNETPLEETVFIVEGEKCVDALIEKGLLATTNSGGAKKWNLGGKNHTTPLQDRPVVILPDQDSKGKTHAQQIATSLHRIASSIKVVELPGLNEKGDVYDWLEAGHSVDELISLVEQSESWRDKPSVSHMQSGGNSKYAIDEYGNLCFKKTVDKQEVLSPLCNFNARIIEELLYDNGVNQTRRFMIDGALAGGKSLPVCTVPASQFSGMSWVTEHWGTCAIVEAGTTRKDHIRAAIQHLSHQHGNVINRTVFQHTGWTKFNGKYVYLHSNGAIGKDGSVPGIYVELDEKLQCYDLPSPESISDIQKAIHASLKLLKLAPAHIMYPSLAAIYHAPLGEVEPIDFSLFFAGPTGVMKSELTSNILQHFGKNFERTKLPGNWSDTANSREKKAFLVKDAIYVIDDFAPSGSTNEIAKYHSDAERIFRAQGNKSGRGRMNANGTLRSEYYPRSLVISSGEDIPKGQSVRGRMLIIELIQGDIDKQVLSELQTLGADGNFAESMTGYIQWLSSRIPELQQRIPTRRRELRDEIVEDLPHSRTIDIIAKLLSGWEQFLQYAVDSKAIPQDEQQEFFDTCKQVLCGLGASQSEHVTSEEPVQRFLELLQTAFSSGCAHLEDSVDGGTISCDDPVLWGWKPNTTKSEYGSVQYTAKGDCIGWLDGDHIYLEPGSVYKCIQRIAKDQDRNIAVTDKTLWKRLKEKGVLASHEPNRSTSRKSIHSKRRNVLHLKIESIYPTETAPIEPTEPANNEINGLWLDSVVRKSSPCQESSHKTEPKPEETKGIGTNGAIGSIIPDKGDENSYLNQDDPDEFNEFDYHDSGDELVPVNNRMG